MQHLNAAKTTMAAVERAQRAYGKIMSENVLARAARLCDLAEMLGEEFGAVDFAAMVSNITESLTLSVDAPEVTFEWGRSHPFFKKIPDADRVVFSKIKNENGVKVSLIINDIWGRHE